MKYFMAIDFLILCLIGLVKKSIDLILFPLAALIAFLMVLFGYHEDLIELLEKPAEKDKVLVFFLNRYKKGI
jgi:hypothetical protein